MKHRNLKTKQDKLHELEQTIYEKRKQLNQSAETEGLSNPVCLRYSMELDVLINAYNEMLRKPME